MTNQTKFMFLVTLFGVMTINTMEPRLQCKTEVPDRPSPSPKQQDKDGKSAPSTPRPKK